jgi:pimeloyl-ACP methyl ester carboxylesterase
MSQTPVVAVIGGTAVPGAVTRRQLRQLAQASGADHIIPLPDLGLGSIGHTSQLINSTLASTHLSDQPLVLVAYSQGVIVAARYAVVRPNCHVIGLGGPFGGPRGLFSALAAMMPGIRDMARGCDPMTSLQRDMQKLEYRLHSIYSLHDPIVPWRSSHVEGAANHCLVATKGEFRAHMAATPLTNVYLTGRVDHWGLVHSTTVHDIVSSTIADIAQVAAA